MIFADVHELFDYCNQHPSVPVILDDVNLHFDCHQEPNGAKMIEKLNLFFSPQGATSALMKKVAPLTGLCVGRTTLSSAPCLLPSR